MKIICLFLFINFSINIFFLESANTSDALSSQLEIQKIVHWRNRAIDLRNYMSKYRPPSGLQIDFEEVSKVNNKCFYEVNLLNLMQFKLDKISLELKYDLSHIILNFTNLNRKHKSKLDIEIPCTINEISLNVDKCSSNDQDLTKFCSGSLKLNINSKAEIIQKIIVNKFNEKNLYIRQPFRFKTSKIINVSEIDISISGITDDIANRLFLDDIEGLLITNVKSLGLGGSIGFRKGDIIAEVDQEVLLHPLDFDSYIKDNIKKGKSTLILIYRDNDYEHFVINIK